MSGRGSRANPFPPAALALLFAPTLLSCDLVTEPGCSSDCTLSTRVEGQVVDGVGVPVPGAALRMRPLFHGTGGDECVDSPLYDDELDVLTEGGAAGEFSAEVRAPSVDLPRCVEVRADPPAGQSLLPATDTIRAGWAPPGRAVPAYYALLVLYGE